MLIMLFFTNGGHYSSMTPRERRQPNLISGSRKRRITQGSGTNVQDLNRL